MPDFKRQIRQRLAKMNLSAPREAEIIEELAQHAEDRYREMRADGASDAEARRAAMEELGAKEFLAGELHATEHAVAANPAVLGSRARGPFFAGLGQDLRYGFRTLRKSPGFTAVAMIALALGIGANTAIFSVVNGVLLQPLSYPEPGRLLNIYESTQAFRYNSVAYPDYLDWKAGAQSFAGMGAYRSDFFNFTGMGEPEQLSGEYVTASLLPVLGVHPRFGRTFSSTEDREGAACTAMVTTGFWKRRLAADPGVLGKNLTLNGMPCTVIGVLPANFRLGGEAEVYLPMETYNSVELRTRESHPGLRVIGRLKPGVKPEAAQAEVAAIAGRLALQYPKTNAGYSARVVAMKDDIVGGVRSTLLLLLGAVGFVLIIACANVANLLLARSTARKREFAIRAALGADRGRVVRQLLTESLLLSLGGGLIGLLLAGWGTRLVLAAAPANLPRADGIGIDPYVLLFTLAVSVATGILFGLAPALLGANTNPQESLKEGTRGSGGGKYRAEGIFVALEMGLAVVLLAGAGLMIQSVWRLWKVDPGFNPHHILTAQVALSPTVAGSAPRIRQAFDQMLERVAATPGVEAAAISSQVPLGEGDSENSYWPGTGPQPPQDQLNSALFYIVTPGYRSVLPLPLLAGRFIDRRDIVGSPPVIVIDQVMAKHLFPGQDPVGKQISMSEIGPITIVGVVGHVKQWGLDSDDTSKIRDQIYFSIGQVPDQFLPEAMAGLTIMLR
ncbi:MAG TPA: ABC transporter permease, partial [Rhodopila sp.]|nr:ABC transporter permease [Rhodopila sp.]